MSNHESSKQEIMNNGTIQPLGKIISIMLNELKSRNLEYMELQSWRAPDKNRIVFDMLTTNLNSKKNCVVHVDFIQTFPTVEQFLDCVYGSGSTSDIKIIIYDDNYFEVATSKEWTELYFVTRLINKCNAVSIPFDIIGYNHPTDKSILEHYYTFEFDSEAVESYLLNGPLPAKWDIQRMAFWAMFYNTNHDMMEPYELHRLQPERSLGFQVSDYLGVFMKWIEDGIFYVITDSNNSEFIPWLWKNREKYFGKDFPDRSMSTYRDGVSSCMCLLYSDTPIHKLESMSSSGLNALGRSLFNGASNMTNTVTDAIEQYSRESEQVKDVPTS